MKSWYKVTEDITLKDGSTIKEDRLTFETTDKDISKRVEAFFKSLMDTADTPQTDCDHRCVQAEVGCEKTDCPWK